MVALPLLVLGVLVVNGFGEEVGWRGMLAHRLLDRHSLLTTSVMVWVVWAAWHLPVFLLVADFREMGWTALGWLVVGVVVHERREVRGAGSRTPRASPSTGSS